MSEQLQQRPLKPAKPARLARRDIVEGQPPGDNEAASIEQALGLVTLAYGPYEAAFPLGGKTVAYVREHMAHVWHIPTDALPVIGGQPISGLEQDRVLQNAERLEFMKDAGEKG